MEGKRRGESGYYRHGDSSTATSKLIKALAEKSRSKVTRLMRTPVNMVGSPFRSSLGTGGGNGLLENDADSGDLERQAGLIRELTEKLRDSEFRVTVSSCTRDGPAAPAARKYCGGYTGWIERLAVRTQLGVECQHRQSLSSLALRELDSLRRELSAIGSRDASRMKQIKEMEYVGGALEAMSEGSKSSRDEGGVNELTRKKEADLSKDIAFFKPLIREELAYSVDELVLLNERLHVSVLIQ